MTEMEWILLTLTETGSKLTVYEFEDPYDPSYLNLDPNDEDSWKVYAEKVRDLMSKVLKIPFSN